MGKKLVTFEAPVELVEWFDRVASAQYMSRSALLRMLMAREIGAFCGSSREIEENADHDVAENR